MTFKVLRGEMLDRDKYNIMGASVWLIAVIYVHVAWEMDDTNVGNSSSIGKSATFRIFL